MAKKTPPPPPPPPKPTPKPASKPEVKPTPSPTTRPSPAPILNPGIRPSPTPPPAPAPAPAPSLGMGNISAPPPSTTSNQNTSAAATKTQLQEFLERVQTALQNDKINSTQANNLSRRATEGARPNGTFSDDLRNELATAFDQARERHQASKQPSPPPPPPPPSGLTDEQTFNRAVKTAYNNNQISIEQRDNLIRLSAEKARPDGSFLPADKTDLYNRLQRAIENYSQGKGPGSGSNTDGNFSNLITDMVNRVNESLSGNKIFADDASKLIALALSFKPDQQGNLKDADRELFRATFDAARERKRLADSDEPWEEGEGETDDTGADEGEGTATSQRGGGRRINFPRDGRSNVSIPPGSRKRFFMPNIEKKIEREINRLVKKVVESSKDFIESGEDYISIDFIPSQGVFTDDDILYFDTQNPNAPQENDTSAGRERMLDLTTLVQLLLSSGDPNNEELYNYKEYIDIFELYYDDDGKPFYRFSVEIIGDIIEDLEVILVNEDNDD